jgi:hypothetical protein
MATKKPKTQTTLKKVAVNPPKDTPMDKFHQAMKKIISVPKKELKNK